MPAIDKATLTKLKKFSDVFKEAQERGANEADTVMYLVQFFRELFGYDPLRGEITKEVAVKDRYCDFGIKLDEQMVFLVEAKAAGIKNLNAKHIEQTENYASRAAINWALLTNGVTWQLYHLTFSSSGIEHEAVLNLNFPAELEKNPDSLWDALSILAKNNVLEKSLETYYEQQKLLCPKTIVTTLLGLEVLTKVRQELNREAPARLEMQTVFDAVVKVLSNEALAEAGSLKAPIKKHHRKHHTDKDQSETQTPDISVPQLEPTVEQKPVALTPVQPLTTEQAASNKEENLKNS